jgi:hypothetical protein
MEYTVKTCVAIAEDMDTYVYPTEDITIDEDMETEDITIDEDMETEDITIDEDMETEDITIDEDMETEDITIVEKSECDDTDVESECADSDEESDDSSLSMYSSRRRADTPDIISSDDDYSCHRDDIRYNISCSCCYKEKNER